MTTASHIERHALSKMQDIHSALCVAAQYSAIDRPAALPNSDTHLYIYNDLPINEEVKTRHILNFGDTEVKLRPVSSSDSGRHRWQQFAGGSITATMFASDVLREGKSVSQNFGGTASKAQQQQKDKIYPEIRHDIICCGGSIFARYD